jgi:hypothetical protein
MDEGALRVMARWLEASFGSQSFWGRSIGSSAQSAVTAITGKVPFQA